MQQQTKHTRRAYAGGVAPRYADVARQTGAALTRDDGVAVSGADPSMEQRADVPPPADALSGGAGAVASAAAAPRQAEAGKAAGVGKKTGAATEKAGAIPGLPPGGFATVLVDPPWPAQGGEKHYRTMSLARIMALPVDRLAARHAHLWLWTTNALLPTAYEVAAAWGFTVRSPMTWVKFGLGRGGRYQLRNATEQLLLCTRGTAPLGSRSQPTWFNAPVTEHSRKPAEQFAIIERISPGPYLELFARRRPESRQSWAVWGDQVDSDIRIPGYAVPRYSERVAEAEVAGASPAAATNQANSERPTAVRQGGTDDDRDDGNGDDRDTGDEQKEALR